MKTRLLIITMIVIGIIISGIAVYLFDQMYDCLYPPIWMKTPRSGFDHCWELFLNGYLPDWSDAREDYAKKQAHKLELIERYKDKPEVVAFYAKYDDVQASVREDHVSYFAGSDNDALMRMNIFFDENQTITEIDTHCYFQKVHQYEISQEDIVNIFEKYDCKK